MMVCGTVPKPDFWPGTPGPDANFGMAPTFVPAALGSGTKLYQFYFMAWKNLPQISKYSSEKSGRSQDDEACSKIWSL